MSMKSLMESLYEKHPPLREEPKTMYEVAVVPGNALTEKGEVSQLGKQRVDGVLEFLKQGLVKRILFAGGGPRRTDLPREAEAMSNYALSKGNVSSSQMLLEKESYTTFGNFYYSKKILEDEKLRTILVYTDDINMLKAGLFATKIFGTAYEIKKYGFWPELALEKTLKFIIQDERDYGLLYEPFSKIRDGDHESLKEVFMRVKGYQSV